MSKNILPKDNLTGIKVKNWIVDKYITKGIWDCICTECGQHKEFRGYHIKDNRVQECTHGCTKKPKYDLLNKTFGELKVIEYISNGNWKCQCSCGKIIVESTYSLKTRGIKSCGHASNQFKDLKGQHFGELEALEYDNEKHKWKCKCSCNKIVYVNRCDLASGNTKSCGHTRGLSKIIDLEGQKINEWTVLNYLGNSYWNCLCSCGKIVPVHSYSLRNNKSKNCNSHIHRIKNLETLRFGYLTSSKSSYEIELRNIFKSDDMICNSKSILDKNELDIYFKNSNTAIEFNGTYWHSNLYKDKNYHQQKTLECFQKGIHLIHIFEYEWLDIKTREKLINYIKSLLNSDNQRIYARECYIKNVNNDEYKEFCDRYHLQNYTKASIIYGLYYDNQLVQLMSFGKPRFNTLYEYEIIRLCSKNNVSIIGGAQKLFNYFIKENKPSSIISYCDISKFTGEVYKKLGFKLYNTSQPGYVWVEPSNNIVLQRYQTQKSKLIEKGLGTNDQSEDEIMQNQGYLKVHNSGNYVFTWSCG